MTRVSVVKTRRMVAAEVAAVVAADDWEVQVLAQLQSRTLRRLGQRLVDGFEPVHHEDLDE